MGFYLYGLGLLQFTLLEIKTETLSKHRHIQVRIPLVVRAMASSRVS